MDKYLGKRLDGRYEIQEKVGIGGMAVVYKAYDNVEHKTVAIKILKEEYTGNDEFLRRFKNESKAIAVLSHPNVVKVFDVSFGDLIQYIVMEYIDGITLKEYIEQKGPLSWNDAVYFTLQILRGLQHAHDKGVVHRDIKPQNIMVLPDGVIKVADFGIARFARSEQETITDKAIGSVHYISPEQARGEKTDEKADIYSVGVMLYEMLTGKLPFQAESAVSVAIMQLQKEPTLPRDINGSIPLGLEQITMHAMQKDSIKRYKSAAEMLCDLEAFKKNPAITFDYDYFVDDSPTKYIPSPVEADAAQSDTEGDGGETKERKNTIIPILLGVTVTFVIALVLILCYAFKFFTNKVDEIELPKFVGVAQDDVVNNKDYEDLYKFEIEYEYNSEYEQGVICKQSPKEGTGVKPGTKVILTVSYGEKLIVFPDVYDKTLINAKTMLYEAGFDTDKIKIEYEASADHEKDHIIRTDPLAKSTVPSDSKITLYVSSGPPEDLVTLISVINDHKDSVKRKLNSAGLELGEITEAYSNEVPEGYVCAMSPSPKDVKEIARGSKVNIVVSKGKIPAVSITVTLPQHENVTQAKVSLWSLGSKLKGTEHTVVFGDTEVKYTFTDIDLASLPQTFSVHYKNDEIGDLKIMDFQVTSIDESNGTYVAVIV